MRLSGLAPGPARVSLPHFTTACAAHPWAAIPLVNVDAIVHALRAVGEPLGNLQLPANAPPVFLLDAERFAGGSFAEPGRFDNRWWVFPQDFPSMNFLQSRGIRSIILGQRNAAGPQEDLAHVLLRWQQGGIQILVVGTNGQSPPIPQQVEKAGWISGVMVSRACAGVRRAASEQHWWFRRGDSCPRFGRRIRLKLRGRCVSMRAWQRHRYPTW